MGQCLVHGPMQNLTVFFNNLCCQGRTNIYAQTKVSTQFKMIIGVWYSSVWKHNPLLKLTKLANVGCLAWHNGFRDFPILFVNAVCSWTLYMTQVQDSYPIVSLGNQTKWASYWNLSSVPLFLFWLHSTMGWMTLSVSNDTMPPWVSNWTLQGLLLWHCHISLQVAPSHWKRRDNASPASLFSFIGSKHDHQNWWQISLHTYCLS